jgi:hypothetical protein
MIDFRYHLISIVAVLLALSLGIVTGSGFLGGPVFDALENRVQAVTGANQRLREQNAAIQQRANASDFALAALEPEILEGDLLGEQAVVVRFAQSDQDLLDGLDSMFENAGGTVATTITLDDELVLSDPDRRTSLAALLGTAETSADALRLRLADVLGQALAAAADGGRLAIQIRLRDLLDGLVELGLLSVEASPATIPSGALFVVAGGGQSDPPYPLPQLAVTLTVRLAARNGAVLGAESSESTWGLVAGLREDPETQSSVWTVDNADEVIGRVSAAMVLQRASERPATHYGTDPGAAAVIPEPSQP